MGDMVMAAVRTVLLGTLLAALAVAAASDLGRRIIPNGCVVAVGASGAVWAALGVAAGEGAGAAVRAVLGVAVVLALMCAAGAVSRRATGRSGVGAGDVKLLAASAVWTGPVWGLAVVSLSCAASISLWLISCAFHILSGNKVVICGMEPTVGGIPLGPGIALATTAVVLFGAPWA